MSSDDIWSKLVHAFKVNDKRFLSYIDEFKKNNPQWIERLRKELLGNNRVVASAILAYLDEKEQMSIFDLLIHYASFTHGGTVFFRDLILGLPKEWVLKNIEKYTNSILDNGDEDEYRRILELFYKLDYNLAISLAERAQKNNNLTIREVGDDFIALL